MFFQSVSEIVGKKLIDAKKNSSKSSQGHVECSFDYPTKKTSDVRPENFAQCFNLTKKFFFSGKETAYLKKFYGRLENTFDNTDERCLT